jgi:hypothetical protein
MLGVAAINFFTLPIPLAQSGEQLIAIRLLTGLAIGFAASAPFPNAAELMPAQHHLARHRDRSRTRLKSRLGRLRNLPMTPAPIR